MILLSTWNLKYNRYCMKNLARNQCLYFGPSVSPCRNSAAVGSRGMFWNASLAIAASRCVAFLFRKVMRILFLRGLDLEDQCLDPLEKQRTREDRPAVDDERRRRDLRRHSSSGDSGLSRSTSTCPTSAWMRSRRLPSKAFSRSGFASMSRDRKARKSPRTGSCTSSGDTRSRMTAPSGWTEDRSLSRLPSFSTPRMGSGTVV